ncbi:MAG: NFACT RNA binding domain-containing protein [Thermodesulfobacteriota bacterium]
MEADFFRCLLPELARVLSGARCRKLAFPAPGLFSLGLSGATPPPGTDAPAPKYLHGRTGPGRFFLFVSDQKPLYPANPPAMAMWLRKRLDGRRILGVLGHWPRREVALCLSAGEGRFLLIDAKAGLRLVDALPEDFGAEPDWPEFERARDDAEIWVAFPHITPRLRKALSAVPPGTARRLYQDIRQGVTEGFFVAFPAHPETAPAGTAQALPLDVFCRRMPGLPANAALRTFPDPLAAAAAFCAPHFFAAAGGNEAQKARADERKQAGRAARALAHLDRDQARLSDMVGQGVFAEAMAANLHTLDPKGKTASLTLDHPEKGTMTLALDPRLTIVQNMNRLFERAAKGRRGLAVVAARRAALSEPGGTADSRAGWPHAARPTGGPSNASPRKTGTAPPPAGESFRGIPAHVYTTDDGLTVLRGKNAKANEDLLRKAASPFDYWFHVRGGPGSHVILRRDHPGQEVPRQSLLQAATLAALASFKSEDSRAEVLMAQVRDVRRSKGFAPGQVRVEAVMETLAVTLDRTLENRLRRS